MSVRGPVQPVEFTHFNLKEERAKEAEKERRRLAQEKYERELKAFKEELKKRMKQVQFTYANNSAPHVKQQIGGTAGEFIRLAKLQPESLAGVVIMQALFFALSLAINKEWHVYNRMYKEACEKGYGYDGTQTIYQIGKDGKPDFNKPYPEGVTIPREVIIANGYMLKRDWVECWGIECIKFVEQQAGHQVIPQDYLALAYGQHEAAALKKSGSQGGGDHTAEDITAQNAMRPIRPTPLGSGGPKPSQ